MDAGYTRAWLEDLGATLLLEHRALSLWGVAIKGARQYYLVDSRCEGEEDEVMEYMSLDVALEDFRVWCVWAWGSYHRSSRIWRC